jgi:hypothetical protein
MRRPSQDTIRVWSLSAGLVLVTGAASLSTSTGCDDGSSTGGGGGGISETDAQGCFDYTRYTPSEATVSFQSDVLPVFEQSCALSASCHGNTTSPTTAEGYQPYLGAVDPEVIPSDVELIRSVIIDQDSHIATMKIVDPGKPETSFLMHKMDGDLSCSSLGCAGDDCLDTMPQGSSPLPRASRDVVREWILQGALDN